MTTLYWPFGPVAFASSKSLRVEKSLQCLQPLLRAETASQQAVTRTWTQSKVRARTRKVEPCALPPSKVDHRSPQKASRRLRPSKTGIPHSGKTTITYVRILKEYYDIYANLFELLAEGASRETLSFAKRALMFLKFLGSKNPGIYQSWYIRSMDNLVSLRIRLLRSRIFSARKGLGLVPMDC